MMIHRILGKRKIHLLLGLSSLMGFYRMYRKEQRSQKESGRMVYADELTGVMNWKKWQETHRRRPLVPTQAFAIVDVDEFNSLNALLGHDYGNAIIIKISSVLQDMIGTDEELCHVRGDRFAMCLRNSPDLQKRLAMVLDEISSAIPCYALTLSCGVRSIEAGLPLPEAYEEAMIALKKAKQGKQNTIAFYDGQATARLKQTKTLENDFRPALLQGHIVPFLQPKMDLRSGKWSGCEVLARWHHPRYGRLDPGSFIPVLENNGMIAQLDRYMLEHTCRIIRRWRQEGKTVLPISVNISRSQFAHVDLVEELTAIVRHYDIPFHLIELEITEQAALCEEWNVCAKLRQLRQRGFTISIDDFGTGYSSLACLKTIPAAVVKLDKKFIYSGAANENSHLIKDIVVMAKHCRLAVLMEGVETEAQLAVARDAGCEIVQGFYFAKPMPVRDCEKLLYGKRGT